MCDKNNLQRTYCFQLRQNFFMTGLPFIFHQSNFGTLPAERV